MFFKDTELARKEYLFFGKCALVIVLWFNTVSIVKNVHMLAGAQFLLMSLLNCYINVTLFPFSLGAQAQV